MKLFEVSYDYNIKGEYNQYVVIGVFNSRKKAKNVVRELRRKKKFAKHRDRFFIQKVILDPLNPGWEGGFFSYRY